jgi:hypothetical protein
VDLGTTSDQLPRTPGQIGQRIPDPVRAHSRLLALQGDFPAYHIAAVAVHGETCFFATARHQHMWPDWAQSGTLGGLRAQLEQPMMPFSVTTPNIARVQDCLLGGKDNFAPDREHAGMIAGRCPDAPDLAAAGKEFVTRAVTWSAGQGVSQFLDAGTGLPTPAPYGRDHKPRWLPVHEAARAVNPDARTVYADYDPMVLAHVRALLATGPGVAVAGGDVRDPHALLAKGEIRGLFTMAEPVCVVLAGVLHYLDAATARDVVAGFISSLAIGSCVIASVWHGDGEAGDELAAVCTERGPRVWNHTLPQIGGLFDGLDLVPPGLADARAWQPGPGGPVLSARSSMMVAGAGRKTRR